MLFRSGHCLHRQLFTSSRWSTRPPPPTSHPTCSLAQDYHQREGITRLFPLMMRGASAAGAGAAFLGTLACLSSMLHPHYLEDAQHPMLAGAAGTAVSWRAQPHPDLLLLRMHHI